MLSQLYAHITSSFALGGIAVLLETAADLFWRAQLAGAVVYVVGDELVSACGVRLDSAVFLEPFEEDGLELGRPDNLGLVLRDLPALTASGNGGDGFVHLGAIGELLGGGDMDVLRKGMGR